MRETTESESIEVDGDRALIDEAFDRALASLERGEEFDVESLARGHEHLRAEMQEAARLAREICVHGSGAAGIRREVGGYEIEREIGAGSMGTVFLARQRSLNGRPVALKVLPPSLGISGNSKARFFAEANALAKLDHPNVVGVHDVIDADGIVAFAMDWIPGGSLAGILAAWRAQTGRDEMEVLADRLGVDRSRLAFPNAITWLLQSFSRLARALASVHEKGLLHRDIKPGNLLVRGDGEILLSDFGLVRDDDAMLRTRTGQFVGTLAYSPPEQLRGEREAVGPHSDVYSLSITLFEALTLHLPFGGRSASEMQRRAESGHFDPPRRNGVRLPRDLATILGKALDPDPIRRYHRAHDLAEDLERLLSFRPVLARPAGRGTRIARFLRRNRASVSASSVVSVLVIVLAVQASRWWVQRQRADEDASASRKKAQLALLEPRTADRAQTEIENLEKALTLFDEALRFRPNEGLMTKIALERRALELAIALRRGRTEIPPDPNVQDGSLTIESFRSWKSGARPTLRQLDDTSDADRRTYGLLAYLMGEPEHASEAWEPFAGRNPMNFLADALIGEYSREQGKYLEAFALLRPALDHFNEANFLYVRLADVAVGMGKAEIGEDLLKQSESKLDYIDPYETGDRVRADLCALRGQNDEARERYVRMMQRHQGAIARYHFSQFLELQGEPLEALKLLDDRLPHEFVRLAAEWWNSGSEPTWQRLRACLADPSFPLGPFPGFVERYREAREQVKSGKSGKGLLYSPFTSALAQRRRPVENRVPSLLDLAVSGELAQLDLCEWRKLPLMLQNIHAAVLCAGWTKHDGSMSVK